jgi:hypothetical protein
MSQSNYIFQRSKYWNTVGLQSLLNEENFFFYFFFVINIKAEKQNTAFEIVSIAQIQNFLTRNLETKL